MSVYRTTGDVAIAMTVAARRRRWRKAQEARTLVFARSLPFYRSHWAGWDREPSGPRSSTPSLLDLPTFGKTEYLDALDLFTPAAPLWTNHTSGSSGEPVARHRPIDEVRYLERFLSHLAGRERSEDGLLTVRQWEAAHGSAVTVTACGPVRAIDLDGLADPGETLVGHVVQPVLERQTHRPVRTLVMGLEAVITFTAAMEDASWPPHQVSTIVTVGGLVSPFQISVLERLWGARVHDRFSASEVIGGSSRCSTCNWYHPDPYVIYGCVSVEDRLTEVSSGVGLLTMTEMWPLVRAAPLIRYRTGDLVEVIRGACSADDLSFRWLGRYEPARPPSLHGGSTALDSIASVRVPQDVAGAPILRPAVVLDALGPESAVRRKGPRRSGDLHLLGEPKVAFDVGPGSAPRITIRATAASPGARWSGDPVALVLEGQPELRRVLGREGGRLHVELVSNTHRA